MTESAFERMVLSLARLGRWRTFHARPGRTARGWRTPVSGDGKGFPDWLFVRGPVLLVRELKTDTGKVSPEQAAWLDALLATGQDARVWRPRDWAEIEATLTREDS